MAVSALDSGVFRNLFGTQEMRDVFSDKNYVKCLVEVEAALARAQSKTGVIPDTVGEQLTTALSSVTLDFEKLSRDTDIVGYPVLPLVEQLVAATPPDVAKYIHWGATTQDIMDNATMIQVRRGLQIVKREIHALAGLLTGLAEKHRDTPMAGRTHLQHALPCTFGYKCAVYLSAVLRHAARLRELEPRCLLVQFGGAAGTLASLGTGTDGVRVRAALAAELGLHDPPITWHAARDTVAEVLGFLALVGASLGKVAYDVIVMSSSEFGEVAEPFAPHRGASSTMPQKRNPISSEVVLAAARLLRGHAALGLDAVVVDFERASGPWHLEWVAVPEAFVLAAGALHQTNFVLAGLVVNTGAMLENLGSSRGLIVGEAVMMALARHIGRQPAHDVVYEACRESIETGKLLLDVLRARPEVVGNIGDAELVALCDPRNYFGSSRLMVDNVVKVASMSFGQQDM
ncbi:adenylosuccinate lyase [Biscogniauxia mediterranea]|nr:adenylosuccinate lyase [Biscogniauxia mediterranea]